MTRHKGTQYSIQSAKKQMLEWLNEEFPNDSPHHIVFMGNDEYQKRIRNQK